MKKPHLPFLETMITQVCNLSCQGCTNYSDLSHQGYETWRSGQAQLTAWLEKINIEEFGIIGGEPLINPEWALWVQGVRDLLPGRRIRFTTNGLLLHKTPDIIDFFESLGNITFKITVHTQDPRLESTIERIKNSRDWQEVLEHGIYRWAGPNGLRLQINRPNKFLKTFRGDYSNMMPWNSPSGSAFAACCQRTCPLLYQGRLYKCSTSGLLNSVLSRFQYPNMDHWQPYLNHGIGPDSSDIEIHEFVENFGRVHKICGQCPTAQDQTIDHAITVHRK